VKENSVEVSQKVNPKDLTNEELEFIIKTGQLPASVVSKSDTMNSN
jgi:hypothetical protein